MRAHTWIAVGIGTAIIAVVAMTLWPGDASDALDASASTQPASGGTRHNAWGPSPFAADGNVQSAVHPHRSLTDALPPVLFARNGRIVDLQGLSAADYIAQWSSRARTGDAEAAYKVFQAADVCAAASEPLPQTTSIDDQSALQKERAELDLTCKNVTPAQIAERMEFLAAAAHAGNHDAQIDFYMEGPNGRQPQAGDDDAMTTQWKRQSLTYLQAAAAGGDTFSLGLLANVYDAGLLTAPDAKLSLAYTVADMTARNLPASLAVLRSRFGNQLSDADFNAAMQMGMQIAAQCCGK